MGQKVNPHGLKSRMLSKIGTLNGMQKISLQII